MNSKLLAISKFSEALCKETVHKEETLSERLRFALKTINISKSELARRIGVKQQAIQYLCSSNTKASSFTYKIADALNINPIWLATGRGYMFQEEDVNYQILRTQQKIPLITTDILKTAIVAQTNISAIDVVKWVLTEKILGKDGYALTIKDQSMFPRFEENTIILINREKKPKSGDYVVAYVHKNKEILFRQLILKNNKNILQPMNLNGYQSIVMTQKDVICGVLEEARWTF